MHANAREYRVDLHSECRAVETGKRRAVHSAAHGPWYLSRTTLLLRSSDATLTVSLYHLMLLSFSLAFEALIS